MSRREVQIGMREALQAVADLQASPVVDRVRAPLMIARRTGCAEKQAVRKLEKASGRLWIDYGTSINFPWLTDEGKAKLAELST